MKVCYFGDYNPEYSRNRVLLRGLVLNGIEVIECRTNLKGEYAKKELISKFKKINNDFDYLIVGYSDSRFSVPLVKSLTNKPVIWDAFYSLYDSWVYDKKLRSPFSLRAVYYWFLDYRSCRLADLVLVDTQQHVNYFRKVFFVPKKKINFLLVGTDETIFFPRNTKKKSNDFIVFFLGKFIPLQGVQYIIKAAAILQSNKDIKFQIIGRGQTYKDIKKLVDKLKVKNIEFIDPISYNDIPGFIEKADICLGIFGDTNKTTKVIPNKVYEAAAMAKPIITADTHAIHELFVDKENILLCRRSNSEDLAEKILLLKNDAQLRQKIADGSFKAYNEKANTELIGINLIKILQNVN